MGFNSFLKARFIASSSARKGYFFQAQVYERVEISFVKVYEAGGGGITRAILVCKRTKKG